MKTDTVDNNSALKKDICKLIAGMESKMDTVNERIIELTKTGN